MAYTIQFSPNARDHVRGLRKRDQQIIIDKISHELTDQPDQPTGHRKPLKGNPIAPWELRIGDFRVFYDISNEEKLVVVVAIGEKTHNRLRIGGEEIDL